MSSYMKPDHILMAVATAAHNTFETDERALASISLAVSRLPPASRKYEMFILRKKIKAIIGDPAKTSRETVEEIADLLHLHKAILSNRKNQGDLSEWERQEFDVTPAEVHLENQHRFRLTPEQTSSPLPSTPFPSPSIIAPTPSPAPPSSPIPCAQSTPAKKRRRSLFDDLSPGLLSGVNFLSPSRLNDSDPTL